jgi:hypothetical protein
MPLGYRHKDETKKAIGKATRERMAGLSVEPVVCEGCGKAYRGAHGLKVHKASCRSLGAVKGPQKGAQGSGLVTLLEGLARQLEEGQGSFFELRRGSEAVAVKLRELAETARAAGRDAGAGVNAGEGSDEGSDEGSGTRG